MLGILFISEWLKEILLEGVRVGIDLVSFFYFFWLCLVKVIMLC